MNALVVTLLAWLGTVAPDYADTPPPLFIVELDEAAMRTQSVRMGLGGESMAMYACGQKTVYLAAGFKAEDVRYRSILVHELTHHAQCLRGRLGGRETICDNEREAYGLQALYLRSVSQYASADALEAYAAKIRACS